MENRNKNNEPESNDRKEQTSHPVNPFENNQSAEEDIAQSQEELDKEQQFKEAQTERD